MPLRACGRELSIFLFSASIFTHLKLELLEDLIYMTYIPYIKSKVTEMPTQSFNLVDFAPNLLRF